VKIIFEERLCIQCHACEMACKSWRRPEPGLAFRWVTAEESGSFPDTRVSYCSVACLHCESPACAAVCPVSAISKGSDGVVRVNPDCCVGCRRCLGACKLNIPQFKADGTMCKCDLCADISPEEQRCPCVKMCPSGALTLVP